MGVNCSCQKVESEEETFYNIFSSLNLNEIEANSAYSEFQKCINKEDGFLDYFLFKNFLYKIVGESIYKSAQINFFDNLRKSEDKNQNLKKIGALIIFLAKGSVYQKVELLYEHYMKYYSTFDENSVKNFLEDLINMHTDNCIVSFRQNLDLDTVKTMKEAYKDVRKRQLLYHILMNFERVRIKYVSSPNLMPEKLNNSFDIENDFGLAIPPVAHSKQIKEEVIQELEQFNTTPYGSSNNTFKKINIKINNQEKVVKEFIELSYNHLKGEYIRNWLYDNYIKEKTFENVCI